MPLTVKGALFVALLSLCCWTWSVGAQGITITRNKQISWVCKLWRAHLGVWMHSVCESIPFLSLPLVVQLHNVFFLASWGVSYDCIYHTSVAETDVKMTLCRYSVNPEQCELHQQQCCDHHGYWDWRCCSALHNYLHTLLFFWTTTRNSLVLS